MSVKFRFVFTAIAASALMLSGCAAEPSEGSIDAASEPAAETTQTAPESEPEKAEESEPEPVTQEKTCDWGSGPLKPGSTGEIPTSTTGNPNTAIIGSWQHTHIDEGGGFDPVNDPTDIRYVFPSATELLYCQNVPGITDEAENEAEITINDREILLPGGAGSYVVEAWSNDAMVWTNTRDGSLYLLQRR